MHVDGPSSRLPVNTHVGHFRQPPGGHLVEMLQGAELAAAQEVRFHEVKRPFHFAFRLRPPGTAGHRPEAVMRGEGQKAGVVDRLVAVVTRHDDLHVIVETGGGHASKVLEGPHVFADRGLHVLGRREVQILPPGIAQHVAEEVHLAAAFLGEVDRIDRPVHLGLGPRPGLKTLHGRAWALLPQLSYPLAEHGVAALVAAGAKLLQESDCAHVGIPRQVIPQQASCSSTWLPRLFRGGGRPVAPCTRCS